MVSGSSSPRVLPHASPEVPCPWARSSTSRGHSKGQRPLSPAAQRTPAHFVVVQQVHSIGFAIQSCVCTQDRAAASLTISALRRLDFGCRSHTHLRVSPHRRKVQASKSPRVLGVEALIVGKIEKVLDNFEAASLARLVERRSPHLWRFHG